MAATNFKTENNTLRKLIGNGLTYKIPRFQRDYSWEAEQWEDLWVDIMGIIEDPTDSAHYMGYLVLQSTDDKSFDVIDGQQRLTTATLIILAVLKKLQDLIDENIDAATNTKRLEQIRQTYIGYLDPVTLVSRPKLTLNRNNNDYFQNYLVPLAKLPQRGLRASEHLLRKAFDWFYQKVDQYLKQEEGNEGVRLAQLVEYISDNLFFTVITVSDELNAYKVFETLNSRGVRLSSTDLLKNYLFSILDKNQENTHELRNLEERWENIVNRLQSEKFPDFLRIHWNSRNKFTRHTELFKVIRNNIRDRAAVFALLRGMEEDLDTYLSLSSPDISDWSLEDKRLVNILKLFRVRQPFSLLLSAKREFDRENFTKLLYAIMVISFRYNTIGTYSPAELERAYNNVVEHINKKKITNSNQALGLLKSVYIDDQRFSRDFAEKVIKTTDSRSTQLVRFILCEIERYISNSIEVDFSSDTFNIEHILPQNAPDNWGDFSYEEMNALTYRLGNMTLLQSNVNRDLGVAEYSQKRNVLKESHFALTQKLAEQYTEWTPQTISSWQRWLANQAKTIWRVAQLS
ncbi:hypothetical protein AM305_08504 [Actinobacillus minor NM305]|uniref:DUF262 domain-containing protein n=1 Tax=Actinobacillus minor NM305 TaxID=637911 RepID=C5S1C3_9PAST|nr:DUF262 domain-containing protein [Actinobacillus minor]EER47354.1 hypothetical protein AM305_08504 [Actinobacillus minor NM305]